MATSIDMRDLFYIYENSGERVVALRGLNLNVQLGECLAIRGPNGSGKSTLVKLLTGYQIPTAGEILIDGVNIADIDPIRLRREFIASIDQRGSLIRELTVLENLTLAYSLSSTATAECKQLAVEALASHLMSHLSARYSEELSSGERQFISLLAAMATDPKVLVADEPSAELDDAGAAAIYSLLKELSATKIVIIVTHDIRAEEFATRTVRIREGRISEQWSAGEVEQSVIDEFGWMRVREVVSQIPTRNVVGDFTARESSLEVKDLELSYGDKVIFTGVNFAAGPGQLIVVDSSAQAGLGKSSLLRILAGAQDPSAGIVTINGKILGDLDRESRANLRSELASYLPQRGSALELVSLGEYLAPLDLGGSFRARINTPIGNFSGGERARIELLKIIAEGRPILLLDEPTSQMDEGRTFEVIQALFDYLESGGLVVASTRDEILLAAADAIISLGGDAE